MVYLLYENLDRQGADLISFLKTIIKQAGDILVEGFYSAKNVKNKGFGDLVTETDLKIEDFLYNSVEKSFPGYNFVAEEKHSGSDFKGKCFIVDPIDGTTNFVHKLPFVGISVGVYENQTAQAGIVYNPILKELYSAEKGKGAYLNDVKIGVSSTDKMENALIATGFPYDFTSKNRDFIMSRLNIVLAQTRGIRRCGAASIDLCFVAKGIFDGYYEGGLKPWDVSAGALIVEEAGGKVSDICGDCYCFDKQFIVAANQKLHKKIIEVLNG